MFEQRQFIYERGVEHCVCILLEREDIFVLTPYYTWPAQYCCLCRVISEVVVAYYSPYESQICGGDIVVLVYGDGGKGRGIYFKFLFILYIFGEYRVKRMYALHYQDIVGSHLYLYAGRLSASGGKIKFWQFNLLSGKKSLEVSVKFWNIQSINALKIVLAILIQRGFVALYKVVVHSYYHRVEPNCLEMQSNSHRGGCLSAAGWTCNEDEFDRFASLCHHICNGAVFSLMKHLRYLYCSYSISSVKGFVEGWYVVRTKYAAPVGILTEYIGKLLLINYRLKLPV